MQYATAQLPELVTEAQRLSSRTISTFGPLSYEQLNWKPSPERWSVGQCFDHLIETNQSYFPTIDSVIAGQKKSNLWQKLPVLPGLWGKLLIKSLDPSSARKIKAPKKFQP